MPLSVCRENPTCLHEHCGKEGDEDADCEVEESDPSGRYFRYKEVLGKGAFKTVYRGLDQLLGIEVAWNQIRLVDILRSPEDLDRLCAEVHLLKTLKHRSIIKFHHAWVDTEANRINFITELFTSGTLRQYRKKHKHVDIRAVKNWCRQILRGLLYLHSHDPPIIHRDLKCDNIFINGNHGEVKLGDLGLAAILCQTHAAHSIIGTPEFMAPELYEEEYNELVDIYSFGMCVLEMVTSQYPYSECESAAQIYKKVSSGVKPAALDKLKDPELCQFVGKCIDTVSRRLPARELLMDPFLQYDKDLNTADCQPAVSRNTSSLQDCKEDFGGLLRKASLRSLHLDTKSSLSHDSSAPQSLAIDESILRENVLPRNPLRRLTSMDFKQEKPVKNLGFKVKGKRRENDTVYLRLRISAEGNVRIIHFPFDVEVDTAMCVASEMVEELDLADQDVIKIAEMIDTAVLFMVPEWKPGVAIDERCDGEELLSKDQAQDDSRTVCCSDASTLSSDSSLLEPHAQVAHGVLDPEIVKSSLAGAAPSGSSVHGRFEEVMYHRWLEHGNHKEEPCTPTPRSCEYAGDDWEQTSSSDNSTFCPDNAEHGEIAYMSQGSWQSIDEKLNGLTSSDSLDHKVMGSKGFLQNDLDGDDGDEQIELLMQAENYLTLKFQQELEELQNRHQRAILELRKEWPGKRAAFYGGKGQLYGNFMRPNGSDDGHKEDLHAQQQGRYSERAWRNNRMSTAKAVETPGRLSFDELASLFALVPPPEDLKCLRVQPKESTPLKNSVSSSRYQDLGSTTFSSPSKIHDSTGNVKTGPSSTSLCT